MRKKAMARAIRNIITKGRREDLVIVIQSYSRSVRLMELFYTNALKTLDIDSADVLLLGWHNKLPSPRIMDRAMEMKEKGLYRFLGLSGHNRLLFPGLARDKRFDLFHVRYNAAHRGAEQDIFARMPERNRPGLVTYTATRWGDLLNPRKMPPGQTPLLGSDCYRFWQVNNPIVSGLLYGLSGLGWLIVLFSTFLINHFDLFGLRQVYLRQRGQPPTELGFRTPFLYKLIRHPIMLGFLMAFWFTPHMTVGHLLFAGMTSAYILIAVQLEERDLTHLFGDTYREYRKRTPRFIPRLLKK